MIRTVATIIVFSLLTLILFNCQPSRQSAELYAQHCSSCHMDNGVGLGELVPSLAETELFVTDRDFLACKIITGSDGNVTGPYAMPAKDDLSAIEIANILNYIRSQWHSSEKEFTIIEVKKALEACN